MDTNPKTPIDHGAVEAARFGISRSPEWPKVEEEHRRLQPTCQACKPGADPHAGLQVHHIFPFHYCIALGRPDLELDQRNLITLCENEAGQPGENHHLLIGHLDDFQSSNLSVVDDAEQTFFGMLAGDIRLNANWQLKEAARLKPLDQMTQADKDDFINQMNTRFPKLNSID